MSAHLTSHLALPAGAPRFLRTDGAFAATAVALAALAFVLDAGQQSMLVEFFYFVALAQLWNILAGYGGFMSLGQQAYLGSGGYVLFALAIFFKMPPLASIVLAGLFAAGMACIVAFAVFRLAGPYLAIGTWVIAEVFRLAFSQASALGAGSGISIPLEAVRSLDLGWMSRDMLLYFVALLLAVAVNYGAYRMLRSKYGLALCAIRDNESAASTMGIHQRHLKFAVYVVISAAYGMMGAFIFLTKLRISPASAFDINWSGYIIFIVVIGGIGTLEGPIIGCIVYFLMRQYLADTGSTYLILLGLIGIVVMRFYPRGIWGELAARHGIAFLPTRWHLPAVANPGARPAREGERRAADVAGNP